MATYITNQGDMWDMIALSEYGDLSAVNSLMAANNQYIGTYIFPAGVSLDIPEIDEDDEEQSELPPWVLMDEEDE